MIPLFASTTARKRSDRSLSFIPRRVQRVSGQGLGVSFPFCGLLALFRRTVVDVFRRGYGATHGEGEHQQECNAIVVRSAVSHLLEEPALRVPFILLFADGVGISQFGKTIVETPAGSLENT